jgi:hypothetical protein
MGWRFQDSEDIHKEKKKCGDGTETVPQQEFQKCFQQW